MSKSGGPCQRHSRRSPPGALTRIHRESSLRRTQHRGPGLGARHPLGLGWRDVRALGPQVVVEGNIWFVERMEAPQLTDRLFVSIHPQVHNGIVLPVMEHEEARALSLRLPTRVRSASSDKSRRSSSSWSRDSSNVFAMARNTFSLVAELTIAT